MMSKDHIQKSCLNPPKGPPPISTREGVKGYRGEVHVSQSPEGSTTDFHGVDPLIAAQEAKDVSIPRRVHHRFPPSKSSTRKQINGECLNPPKGPPPISTCQRKTTVLALPCLNPPKGPPPISTPKNRASVMRPASSSQSPEGSTTDFHYHLCRGLLWSVSIPRRVHHRFPLLARHAKSGGRNSVSIPRRVHHRFPRTVGGDDFGSNSLCLNPPKGPPPISTLFKGDGGKNAWKSLSQSPEGSTTDFHGSEDCVPPEWLQKGLNPPKGPPPISTR